MQLIFKHDLLGWKRASLKRPGGEEERGKRKKKKRHFVVVPTSWECQGKGTIIEAPHQSSEIPMI